MMWKVALPRIGRIIDARQDAVSGDLAEAERLKGQSDAALQAYEKALADARTRAQAIANETRAKQTKEAEAARKVLEDQLNAKLAEADKSIAATKTAAMANIRTIAADTAKAIVERLIGRVPDDKTVEAAVSDAVKG
jgi:F-type H+-transporting ATPase subunit b